MTTPMSTLFCLACTCLGYSVAFTSRLHPVKHTGMSSLLVHPPTHHYKYPLQPFLHHTRLSPSQSTTSLFSSSSSSGQPSSPFHDMDEVPESFAFSYAGDAFSLESWDDGAIRPHPPPTSTSTATATATSTASTITTTTTTATLHHASTPTMTRPNKPRLYKHLYRHYDDISFDSWLRCSDPQAFLESIGYTPSEIQTLANALETKNFWKLDVHDQLAPKIRFVVETLGGGTGRLAWKPDGLSVDSHSTMPQPQSMTMDECSFAVDDTTIDSDTEIPHTMRLYSPIKYLLPPTFFHPSLSMDRTLGPHHAYLAHSDLPHGKQLLDNPKLWQAFLMACQTNTFESLCQEWESYFFPADQPWLHTPERIQDFETAFAAGLIPACKGHHQRSTTSTSTTTTTTVDDSMVHHPHIHDHHPSSLHHHHANGEQDHVDDDHDDRDHDHDDDTDDDAATPNGLVTLLLSHGANAFETDRQGASPLHWAAGNGNLPTVQALLHSIALERQPPSLAPHPPTTPPPLQYFRHNEDVQQQQSSQSSNMVYDYDQEFDNEGSSHHDAIAFPIVLDILDEFREYKHGASPFHWACASVRSDYQDADFEGSYDVCQYLLQQAGERHVELANLPLSSGGTHPSTPIMWAAWAGNLPVVELLLVHGADPLQINPSTNQTVMHFAAASGHADICDLLLHSTKETYRMDDDPSILDKLLWNAVDIFGKAPIDYARDNGHANVVEWMMDKSLGSFLVKETAKGWFVPGSNDNSSSSSSLPKNQPMNPKWSA